MKSDTAPLSCPCSKKLDLERVLFLELELEDALLKNLYLHKRSTLSYLKNFAFLRVLLHPGFNEVIDDGVEEH
jgi:hypothetical protein